MSDKLTTREAAQILGYNRGHIHRLLAQGIIHAERIGNYWFFDRDYIEQLKAMQDDNGRLHYEGRPIEV